MCSHTTLSLWQHFYLGWHHLNALKEMNPFPGLFLGELAPVTQILILVSHKTFQRCFIHSECVWRQTDGWRDPSSPRRESPDIISWLSLLDFSLRICLSGDLPPDGMITLVQTQRPTRLVFCSCPLSWNRVILKSGYFYEDTEANTDEGSCPGPQRWYIARGRPEHCSEKVESVPTVLYNHRVNI